MDPFAPAAAFFPPMETGLEPQMQEYSDEPVEQINIGAGAPVRP